MQENENCIFCNSAVADHVHLFYECTFEKIALEVVYRLGTIRVLNFVICLSNLSLGADAQRKIKRPDSLRN